jgi:hypothetical protein
MSKSFRIRTQVGVDRQVNFDLKQDFDQLEILSIKLRQQDIYPKSCADFGVIVGRVFVNNGFGLPNVKVSVFIPLDNVDSQNLLTSSVYPYTDLSVSNDDGYRYNLLPYEKQHSGHVPTGTFVSKNDILQNPLLGEVYDKYYKFTVKTNESGDYMIMGVPPGNHTVVMDCDLSDIGEFSQSPQDIIDMGLGTSEQITGATFSSSSDLSTLPQIVFQSATVEVNPFWGQENVCRSSIARKDFNLTESGVKITPSAVFMGSIFTNPNDYSLKKSCRPAKKIGELCTLQTGPGEIIGVRQTIFNDENGYPLLETANLPKKGKVIDSNGVYVFNVPMNMDYVTTDENGQQVLSLNPEVGIPTTGKYRFKIKYSQPSSFEKREVRRAYYLVPNVKEYGWVNSESDPSDIVNTNDNNYKKFQSSYYFGLDWSGYTNGFLLGTELNNRMMEMINCEDVFYQLRYKKVYTTASIIDNFKKGLSRQRFLSIKDITNEECESTINRFPTTDAFYKFDWLFFIVNLFMIILGIVMYVLVIVLHALWVILQIVKVISVAIWFLWWTLYLVCKLVTFGFGNCGGEPPSLNEWWDAFPTISKITLPVLPYPDCEACDCSMDSQVGVTGEGLDSFSCNADFFSPQFWSSTGDDDSEVDKETWMFAGWGYDPQTPRGYEYLKRVPIVHRYYDRDGGQLTSRNRYQYFITELPVWENINKFALKDKYFNPSSTDRLQGSNRIRVAFNPQSNLNKYHFDNVIALIVDTNCLENMNAGDLFTFVDPSKTFDLNVSSSTSGNVSTYKTITVTYADPNGINNQNLTQTYNIGVPPSGSNLPYTAKTYNFASDLEYYQVITGMTLDNFKSVANLLKPNQTPQNQQWSLVNSLYPRRYRINQQDWRSFTVLAFAPQGRTVDFDECLSQTYLEYFNTESTSIMFLIRGVDPWSGKHEVTYDLSRIFGFDTWGHNNNQFVYKSKYYLNVPIQSGSICSRQDLLTSNVTTQNNNPNIYFESYLFSASTSVSAYTTTNHLYYSSLDGLQINNTFRPPSSPQTLNSSWSVTNSSSGLRVNRSGSNGVPNIGPLNNYSSNEYIEGGSYILYEEDNDGDGPLLEPIGNYDDDECGIDNNFIRPVRYVGPTYIAGNYSSGQNFPNKPTIQIQRTKLVLRSDRLPTGSDLDQICDRNGNCNTFCLQASNTLTYYVLGETGTSVKEVSTFNTGFGDGRGDDYVSGNSQVDLILQSTTCSGMRSLDCYQYNPPTINVLPATNDCNTNVTNNQVMKGGCYVLLNPPILSMFGRNNDFQLVSDWKLRFRMNFALCRGVIGQTFKNAWINGTLFAYPFSTNVFFDRNNKPFVRFINTFGNVKYTFCPSQIVYENNSNNFYYRSSPYNTTNGFIGAKYDHLFQMNDKYLKNPTTIVDLGPQYFWTREVYFSDEYFGYQVDRLDGTSFNPLEDITLLFSLSRVVNASRTFNGGIVKSLFSRNGGTLFNDCAVDGDYAQMIQINSKYSIFPFGLENYDDPTNNAAYFGLDSNGDSFFGLFLTGDTSSQDLISPKRLNFQTTGTVTNFLNRSYKLPVKTQKTPNYRWNITNFSNTIFGNQDNNWQTNNFTTMEHQRMDRLFTPFFQGQNLNVQYSQGHIFNVGNNGLNLPIKPSGSNNTSIINTGPWYFYFGVVIGETAIDKFRELYVPEI